LKPWDNPLGCIPEQQEQKSGEQKKRKQGKKELLEKYNSKTISGQKTCNKPTKKLNQLKQPR